MRRLLQLLPLLLLIPAAYGSDRIDRVSPGERVADHPRHMIVSAVSPLSAADRASLANAGVEVQQVIAGDRYLVRVRPGADVMASGRVAAARDIAPEEKIDSIAWRLAASGTPWIHLHVLFQSDVTFEDARAAVINAGGALQDPLATRLLPTNRLDIVLAPAALRTLASDDRVFGVIGARKHRYRAENAKTAALSHVTELQTDPYNLNGEGVVLSLMELAKEQETHVEFQGRVTVDPQTSGGPADWALHATHVTGTITAAGLNPAAKGMAPAAHVYEFCVPVSGSDPESSNQCTGDWLQVKDEKLAPLGVVADNNSWGEVLGWDQESGDSYPVWLDNAVYFGAYDVFGTAPLDDITLRRNVLILFAAGNEAVPSVSLTGFAYHYHVDSNGDTDHSKLFCYSQDLTGHDCPSDCTGGCEVTKHPSGPFDTMSVYGAAKDVIAVGAVALRPGTPVPSLAIFSSRGPAKDGRVKPDVVARGVDVRSTVPGAICSTAPDPTCYESLQGTSMATPAVTGMAGLVAEQWRRTFNGATPLPVQTKALLIAGAQDLGNPGPDYSYGFGLVNAKASVDLIIADGGSGSHIRNLTVDQGQQIEIPMTTDTTQNLRVVLNWPDPPILSLPGDGEIADAALVNDLDVAIVDPSGATHQAYVLDKNNVTAPATTGRNSVDNVEMVEIPNAPAGTYRIVVSGTNVTSGPQSAVLVTSAAAGPTAPSCTDRQEPNNTPATAYGNLISAKPVSGAFCVAGDVDYFKFMVTKTGPVTVSITAGDTPLRATLSSSLVNGTIDVPAGQTRTLSTTYAVGVSPTPPLPVTLKIEPTAALTGNATYTFTPTFGSKSPSRRRSVRR